jgi:hypothetical protein
MQNYILHFFLKKKNGMGLTSLIFMGENPWSLKKRKKKKKNENDTGNAIEVKDRKQYWKCQSFAQIWLSARFEEACMLKP